VNFDFSMFSFQVPRELSAAKATVAIIAMPRINFCKMFRMLVSYADLSVPAPGIVSPNRIACSIAKGCGKEAALPVGAVAADVPN
jgi:hypothetical protein